MADGLTGQALHAQLALAQVVCTRLCHDLGGPAGALSGALEMLGTPGDDAAEVARDGARIIDRRLRFWRAALGGPGGDLDAAALAQLGEGLTLNRRASLDLSGLAAGALVPFELTQPLLLAMLVGMEALPRGGVLQVAGSPAHRLTLLPEGPNAAWPPGLAALIAGEAPALTPRALALPLLAATAAMAGARLVLEPGPGAGILALEV
jgi:histidine phosphotransferase ChpT